MNISCIGLGEANGASDKFSAYLFTYFTGNKPGEEQIRFAVSEDGYNYKALNHNRPVIDSRKISSSGGVRDPHILRAEDGKTFYMVATDLFVPKMRWSNYAMILMKSTDLINWESATVNIPATFPKEFGKVHRVWAPQTIYDPKAGKYMIYFSMKEGNDPDTIYYAYATKDFTKLESAPKQLYFPPPESNTKACIDGDIVAKDGKYYLFYKAEDGDPGIKLAISNTLTGGYQLHSSDRIDKSRDPVEGSGIFKLNDSSDWILMYDVYTKGRYQFARSSDLLNFQVIDHAVTMDFHPRHGTVMPITAGELTRLRRQWDTPLTSIRSTSMHHNPVLDGLYADPDILYAEKTGKYYIYPTTDGFDGWSGTFFKAFVSDDLVNWKDEGTILDLHSDVSWAKRNAWAPCIVEKKIDGRFQYFFYFTAGQKIGVAVADDPLGPFKDSGKPLIDGFPPGVSRGQQIDPDVFTDPESGKDYLYWGNGYLAAAELNDDMISVKHESLKLLTPDRTFREGAHVFYRGGIYYFLWSEDDTRSENYRVRYATAPSPMGPLTIPKDNLVIAKDPERGIFATGHNSTIQVPGRDEWYLVYHRFNYPKGITMGSSAGFNREVCIDRMTFDAEGRIVQVRPTLEGIAPISRP